MSSDGPVKNVTNDELGRQINELTRYTCLKFTEIIQNADVLKDSQRNLTGRLLNEMILFVQFVSNMQSMYMDGMQFGLTMAAKQQKEDEKYK